MAEDEVTFTIVIMMDDDDITGGCCVRVTPEGGESVMDVDLHTGRTHQIRVQFARRGWPLLGDDLYGDRMENRARKARTICLHCARMALLGREITSPEPHWARPAEAGRSDI